MSDYSQIVFYAPKDALATGNPLKLIKGTEIDAELAAIATAIASKLDVSGDSGLFADGTAGAPSISFASDTNTGVFRYSADTLAVTGGGVVRAFFGPSNEVFGIAAPSGATVGAVYMGFYENGLFVTRKAYLGFASGAGVDNLFTIANEENAEIEFRTNATFAGRIGVSQAMQWVDGTASAPAYTFFNDLNTGMWRFATDQVALGGGNAAGIVAGGGVAYFADGSVGGPGITFISDSNTGFYRIGSGDMAATMDGVQVARFVGLSSGGMLVIDQASTGQIVGYRDIPPNSQSGNYTAVISDEAKHILHPSGAGAGDTFTIPANGSVPYRLGTVLTFVNRDSNALSIAITTDTMVLAGTTTTGTRTLAQNGLATAIKVESALWIISGTGLT